MATVYITGASGQLGRSLQSLGTDFHFLTREDIELSDTNSIKSFFKNKKADLIIHAGAYTQVDKAESEKDLAMKVNALSTQELAKHCDHFLYVSTDYVYGENNGKVPLTENHPTHAMNHYGTTKLLGEKYALQSNPNTWILRTSWVFSEYGHNFVKTMLKLSQQKDQLNIVADQKGCPTYAYDLAKAIVLLVEKKSPYGVYNFCNSGSTSWCDFTKEIFRQKKIPTKVLAITTQKYPTAAKRPAYSVLDTNKISEHIGAPRPWQEALAECLAKL